jgi:hypothetical protein
MADPFCSFKYRIARFLPQAGNVKRADFFIIGYAGLRCQRGPALSSHVKIKLMRRTMQASDRCFAASTAFLLA